MRIGVIGCGHVSTQHITQLRSMQQVRALAVCDLDEDRATVLARRFGDAKVYTDMARLLDEFCPDLVHILTPPQTHRDLAVYAMEHGVHVLVEKPLAMSAAEAEVMVATAEERGVSLSVCHNYLFVPAVVAAQRLLATGALGQILSAELYWRVTSFADERPQAMRWITDMPGGIFQEVAPHAVYLLQDVLGELDVIAAVTGRGRNRGAGRDEELKALFDSEAGPAVLSISVGSAPVQKYLRVYGTRKTLHIDLATSTLLVLRSYGTGIVGRTLLSLDLGTQLLAKTALNALWLVTGRLKRGHQGLIEHVYRCVRAGRPTRVDGAKGAAAVATLEELWARIPEAASCEAAEQRP